LDSLHVWVQVATCTYTYQVPVKIRIFVKMADLLSSEEPYLVTVLTVSYPHELVVARGRLEAESIPYFVQDELTLQIDPFYSNAMGGLRLQVRQEDVERATEILQEGGFLIHSTPSNAGFLGPLAEWSGNVPVLKNLNELVRVLLVLFVVIAAVFLAIYLILAPQFTERSVQPELSVERLS
jgi:hypothetical protein